MKCLLPVLKAFAFSFVIAGLFPAALAEAEEYVFHHENVLGTSLELRVLTRSKVDAEKVEAKALKEIDRLDQVYSTYSKSELFEFLRLAPGQSVEVSDDLAHLLQAAKVWTQKSKGAFNPAVEEYSHLWQEAVTEKKIPSKASLQTVNELVGQTHFAWDEISGKWTRSSTAALSFNAIAKGTIMDLVVAALMEDQELAQGVSVNIGGDIRVAGDMTVAVKIADPANDKINAAGISTIKISQGAIATSGVSERKFSIDGKSFSHIIDARTGIPVESVISATVTAVDAETADVLATICSMLPVKDSLELVQSVQGSSCLLIDKSGTQWKSEHWAGEPTAAESKSVSHDFEVAFEIAKSTGGGRYRRPYVAVWVEDDDDFPVKTLSLFLMVNNPGPRWHRDLRRWYSSNQMRLLVDDTKLIGTISKPTRNPGQYKVSWDGSDDAGNVLPDGKYTLYLESAREHGSYRLLKYPFEMGGKVFSDNLKGNSEISAARFTYKKK